jgi:hypothetical protein
MKILVTTFAVCLMAFISSQTLASQKVLQPNLDLGLANARAEIGRVMGGATTRAVGYGDVQDNLILFRIGGFKADEDRAYTCNMVVLTDLSGNVVGMSIAQGRTWSAPPFWEINLSKSTPVEVLENCIKW